MTTVATSGVKFLRRLLLVVALVEGPANPLHAGSVVSEPPLELPKLTVTDQRKLLPPESWRYAWMPGLEILSGADDRETQSLLRDFQLFNEAIDVVWPALKEHHPVPLSLILCAPGKFNGFIPARERRIAPSTLLLHDAGQGFFILNFGVKTQNSGPSPFVAAIDYYAQLHHEYVRYLLSFQQPQLPAWLEEGLAQLLMSMRVERQFIEFGKIEDPNLVPIALKMHDPNQPLYPGMIPVDPPDFNRALAWRGLMPLEQFFAVRHSSALALNPFHGRWGAQARGLVHMWLYGENGRYNQAFAHFVARAATEPVSEGMFRDCFKMSYAQMILAFRIYINDTAYRYQQFHAPKGRGLPEPANLALRAATPAEIGRIKGEALVLAGHSDAAWEEFLAPYLRGQRDAGLLASLGLFEYKRGDADRARQFLEAAVWQQTARSRAYVALARLRFAHFQNLSSDNPPRPLSEDQAKSILQLLRAARAQPPPLHETYELLAEVLQHSAAPPTKADLGMLNQGVLLFPRHPQLLLNAAELNGKYGDPAEALTMADYGLKLAQTAEARHAFEALKAGLPTPAVR